MGTPQADYDPTTNKEDSPWYTPSLNGVEGWEATRDLLVSYSGIPPDQVLEHIYKIRDRAWNIFNYPCIGQFRFLDLSIGQAKQYQEILRRVKEGQRLLDLGCCFGQDERRLVADGAPSSNLYACDLRREFTDLGYDLFLDRGKLDTHFFAADVFDAASPELAALDGTVDIINASSFFHLFDWDRQVAVALRVVRLLRRRPGSLVVGRQIGHRVAGAYPGRTKEAGEKYRHNSESWERMWGVVGERTGTRFVTSVDFDEVPGWSRKGGKEFNAEGSRSMRFSVYMQ